MVEFMSLIVAGHHVDRSCREHLLPPAGQACQPLRFQATASRATRCERSHRLSELRFASVECQPGILADLQGERHIETFSMPLSHEVLMHALLERVPGIKVVVETTGYGESLDLTDRSEISVDYSASGDAVIGITAWTIGRSALAKLAPTALTPFLPHCWC